MRSPHAVAHVARNTVRAGRRRSVLVAGLIAAAIAVSVASNVLIRNEKEVAFGGLDLDLWGGLMYMGGADVRVNWWVRGTGGSRLSASLPGWMRMRRRRRGVWRACNGARLLKSLG